MPELIVINEGDPDDEVRLATRYVVCPRCQGEGTHDTWEGGMTGSEMAEQGDGFLDDYLAGVYSIPCSVCKGERVVAVPDESRCTPEQLKTWQDYKRDEADHRAEVAAERRAGC